MVELMIGVFNKALGYFVDSDAVKQAKEATKIKKIEREADWETIQAKASESSWKDEWFTIIFSIPVILAFIPYFQPYVKDGFIFIATMSDWYTRILEVMVYASFGLRAPAVAIKAYKKIKP